MTSPYYQSIVPPGDFVPLSPDDLARSIPERFSEIVAANAQKTAVRDHRECLTYLQLQRLAGKTAAAIRQSAGPSSAPRAVGLIFDPDVYSVAAILGVLANGNFFCPISPRDPPARIRTYLEDAGADVILTTRDAFPDGLRSALQSWRVVFVDELAGSDIEALAPTVVAPHQLAAILYTSGSTGIPKGVMHTHKTLMHTVKIRVNELGVSPSDVIAGLSTFTFGGYYLNAFASVLTGAALHLYDFFRFPFEGLRDWMLDRRITYSHCTPTTLRQFLAALAEPSLLKDLRCVTLGGETVYPNDIYQFQRLLPGQAVLGTTGATIETWFYSCAFFRRPFPAGIDRIPLGFVYPECSVDVRDEQGRKLRADQVGEIAVATACLSPGYWKRPELNAEKYAISEDGTHYYRSGDLGMFTSDGLLYQCGRLDSQVKIRGMRVDLGEIEAALHDHPGVREAVVVNRVRQDNQMELVAYLVAADGVSVSRSAVYRFLCEKLPPHQIPARMIFLESFPLTRTHKVDRKALPEPDAIEDSPGADLIAPRNGLEERLHRIWVAVLGRENFGVTEPFLEAGGDSLSAMRVRNHVEAAFGVSIPLGDLLTASTIESIAVLLQKENPHAFSRMGGDSGPQRLRIASRFERWREWTADAKGEG